jgi:6-phospho-3-hexuloisomerase
MMASRQSGSSAMSAMKTFKMTFKAISRSLENLRKEIDTYQIQDFVKALVSTYQSDRGVFLYAAGRSLLVGKAFSMRLMHLGFKSYVIGEIVTPAMSANDVFLVISETLSNESLLVAIDTAKRIEARIMMVTSVKGNSVFKNADNVILIPNSKLDTTRITGAHTPLGTIFEISVMVLLDSIVSELMQQLEITEEEMGTRHANIE